MGSRGWFALLVYKKCIAAIATMQYEDTYNDNSLGITFIMKMWLSSKKPLGVTIGKSYRNDAV